MTEIRALEIGLIRWGKWAVWLRSEVRALGPCIGVMLVRDEVGTTAGPAVQVQQCGSSSAGLQPVLILGMSIPSTFLVNYPIYHMRVPN